MRRHFLLVLLFIGLVCEASEDGGEATGSSLDVDINEVPSGSSYKRIEATTVDVKTFIFFPGLENIASILDGNKTIWEAGKNETCKLSIVFFNDAVPMVTYLIIEDTSGGSTTFRDLYLKYKNDNWLPSKRSYPTKIESLAQSSVIRSVFTVDVEDDSHGSKCHDYKVLFDEVPTDLFVPRPGHVCNKVAAGENVLWEGEREKCALVMSHLRNRKPYLVHAFIWDQASAFKHVYAELTENGWTPLNQQEYEEAVKATEDVRSMPKEALTGAHLAGISLAILAILWATI